MPNFVTLLQFLSLLSLLICCSGGDGGQGGSETSVPTSRGSSPPVISLTGESVIRITRGQPFEEPGFLASDAQDGDLSAEVSVDYSAAIDTLSLVQDGNREYLISYSVNDSDGNSAHATRSVLILPDDQVPVISLSAMSVTVDLGAVFSPPKAAVWDNIDHDLEATVSGSIDTFTVGTHYLTYHAVDLDGNPAAQMTLAVLVQAAEITCTLKVDGGRCDEILTAAHNMYAYSDRDAPGAIICVQPAVGVQGLYITNVQGAEEAPVTFVNCNGQVALDTGVWTTGIGIQNSRYIRLTGTGSPSHFYGFVQNNSADRGLEAGNGSSDIEIDHVEINNSGQAALTMRTYPFSGSTCLPEYNRSNFTQYNTRIHHVKIDGAGAEGIYVGTSHYHDPSTTTCPDQAQAALIGVHIYANMINSVVNDGIQIGGAISDVHVHDNVIIDYALGNKASHGGGLQLNPGTNGQFYNNYLRAAAGASNSSSVVYAGSERSVYLYNNIFVDSPKAILTLNSMDNASTLYVLNNTFLGDGSGDTFYFFCNLMATVQTYVIKNNIFAGYGSIGHNFWADQYSYFNGNDGTNCPVNGAQMPGYGSQNDLMINGNLFAPLIVDVGFIDAEGGDFGLQAASPAVDAGEDFGSIFATDFGGKARDLYFDMGAYER